MPDNEIPDLDPTVEDSPNKDEYEVDGDHDTQQPDEELLFDRFERRGPSWSSPVGESWPAYDHEAKLDVLITLLPQNLTESEWIRKQVAQEVDRLSALRDDSVVKVLDFLTTDADAYLIEEYSDGEDLETFLNREDMISEDESTAIALGILRALEVAHESGILHRDLRPEHVYIDGEGCIKVRGFSVARILRDQQTALQREMKDKARILAYTPPEDLLNMGMDMSGDLYSFGCLLYHLHVGQPPFTEGNIAYAHVHHQPVMPSEHAPSISEATEQVILRCLAKKPEERFQSAGELRFAFEESGVDAPGKVRKGFNPLLPLAAAVILIVAAAGVVFFLKSRGKENAEPGKENTAPVEAGSSSESGFPERSHVVGEAVVKNVSRKLDSHDFPAIPDAQGKESTEDAHPGVAGEKSPEQAGQSEKMNRDAEAEKSASSPDNPETGKDPGKTSKSGTASVESEEGKSIASKSNPEPVKADAEGEIGKSQAGEVDAEPKVENPAPEKKSLFPDVKIENQVKLADDLVAQGKYEEAVSAFRTVRDVLKDQTIVNEKISRAYLAWGDSLVQAGRLLDAQMTYRVGLQYGEDSRDQLLATRDLVVAFMNKGLSVSLEPAGPLLNTGTCQVSVTLKSHPLKSVLVGNATARAIEAGHHYVHEITALEDGSHTIKIEVMDAAGNLVIRNVRVEVDTCPPIIDSFSPREGEELTGSKVVFRGQADGPVAGIYSQPENQDVVIKGNAFTFTVPVTGLFPEVRFAVLDRAGNKSKETKISLYNPTWIPPDLEPRGDKFYSLKDRSYMVRVPGVEFVVRDDRGRPRNAREYPFFADVTEVTNAQYRRFLDWVHKSPDPYKYAHPSQPANKNYSPAYWEDKKLAADDLPVVGVDWWDAYAYARWAGKSLFTDASWIVAARGVPEAMYPWGDAPPRRTYANYLGGTVKGPMNVMSFPKGRSPFGCYDMAGNVLEWCLDTYPEDGERLIRGGSWFHTPAFMRIRKRVGFPPGLRTKFIGFRCAKYLKPMKSEKKE